MSETAPTPITINIDGEKTERGIQIKSAATLMLDGKVIAIFVGSDSEENCAYIGQAVNAHESMKEALILARQELLWAGDQFEGGTVVQTVVDHINKAIALTEPAS